MDPSPATHDDVISQQEHSDSGLSDGEDSASGISQQEEHDPGSLASRQAQEDREQAQEVIRRAEELRQAAALIALEGVPQQLGLGSEPTGIDDPEEEVHATLSTIENVQISQNFIKAIREAMLDNGGLDKETTECLRNPAEELVDISDPDICLSLDLFFSVTHASEAVYISC